MDVDIDYFRALARSSPWRWRTLRFVVTWTGADAGRAPVRAWVQRPYGLRVELLDGQVVQASWQDPSPGIAQVSLGGPVASKRVEPVDPLADGAPAPELRPDGLVARRPSALDIGYDDPMLQNYQWVAMLDPVDLADGSPDPRDDDQGPGEWGRQPALAPVELLRPVVEVDHGGRPAWHAVLRTTDLYDPRCTCCPLLAGQRAADLEAVSGWPPAPGRNWPSSWRVRLDVGTGVVVEVTELGGDRHGTGFRVDVEEVDGAMDRSLFTPPPPPDDGPSHTGLLGRQSP